MEKEPKFVSGGEEGMERALIEAKKYSRCTATLGDKAKKRLEIDLVWGNLEKDFWEQLFNQFYLLGKELRNPRFLMEISELWAFAHQGGFNTINEYIEAGKQKGPAEEWELKLQEAVERFERDWFEQNKEKFPKDVTASPFSFLNANTESLKGIWEFS